MPPADPERETTVLKDELAALRAEVDAHRNSAEAALATAAEELELRQLAEELLQGAEAEAADFKAKLISIQAQTVAQRSPLVQQSIASAQQNGRYLDLDERETRRLIDAQLRSGGWEADTEEMRYSQGTRPVKGRYMAIAEWQTASGNADYALFSVATGTGKTKTSISLVYRLLKTNRFRRILFIVDRSALGEQTEGAFKETLMENLQTFADIFMGFNQSRVKKNYCQNLSEDGTVTSKDHRHLILLNDC